MTDTQAPPRALSDPQQQSFWAYLDAPLDRRNSSATKWQKYAARPEILPFWIADMDLPTPPFILDAVRDRLEHPVLGYTDVPETLIATLLSWLERRYRWQVPADWLCWITGVVPGLEVATRAVAEAGDPLLLQPPVYYPFLKVPQHTATRPIMAPLVRNRGGWEMDLDALNDACRANPLKRARALLFCNPQNPTGRRFERGELEALGQLAEQQNLIIISDEIHAELLLDDGPHIPIASLDPSLADRCITLLAPGKTYNLPGLSCAVAIIPNPRLRAQFNAARAGLVGSPGVLGYSAAEAAWAAEDHWLLALRAYLQRNRDALAAVAGARAAPVEATYLSWLDVRDLELPSPGGYFESHGLGLSDGAPFGGKGFVRFNFGCQWQQLQQGLDRLRAAFAAAPRRS